MRKLLLSLAMSISLALSVAAPTLASPPFKLLPAASCNQGTVNAHGSIPETNGTGATTPGHMAVPDSEEGPCSHGGS